MSTEPKNQMFMSFEEEFASVFPNSPNLQRLLDAADRWLNMTTHGSPTYNDFGEQVKHLFHSLSDEEINWIEQRTHHLTPYGGWIREVVTERFLLGHREN